jgi:hypothetical protein
MALSILTSAPSNNDLAVQIDTEILMQFSKPIDKFSILNGLSIYTIGSQTWTGLMLSQKDALTSDVKSDAGEISTVEFSVAVSGSNIVIYPITKLLPDKVYFIQVAPGNDATRFVSAITVNDPIYSTACSGDIEILSSFTGKQNTIYRLVFTSQSTFDLLKNGEYDDSFVFLPDDEIIIDKKLKIKLSDYFINSDFAELVCFPAEGLDSLCKITFTTAKYEETTTKSIRIEDKLYNININPLSVIKTFPSPNSINNKQCNPIIIKFNRNILSTQDLQDKIKINKLNLYTGAIHGIGFVYEILGDTLKIFMQSVTQNITITSNDIYRANIATNDIKTIYLTT